MLVKAFFKIIFVRNFSKNILNRIKYFFWQKFNNVSFVFTWFSRTSCSNSNHDVPDKFIVINLVSLVLIFSYHTTTQIQIKYYVLKKKINLTRTFWKLWFIITNHMYILMVSNIRIHWSIILTKISNFWSSKCPYLVWPTQTLNYIMF